VGQKPKSMLREKEFAVYFPLWPYQFTRTWYSLHTDHRRSKGGQRGHAPPNI